MLFDNYSDADGLCSNTVWAIEQDNQGFIWIGTKGGLNRFDGYDFRQFNHQPKDSLSLTDNFVRSIAQVDDNRMVVGTERGLSLLDIQTEQFIKIAPEIDCWVTDILVTSNEKVWVATINQGVFIYDKYDSLLKSPKRLLPNVIVRAITEHNNSVVVGSFGAGIVQYDPQGELMNQFTESDGSGLKTNNILSLFSSEEGVLWVGTLSSGLQYLDKESQHFAHYSHNDRGNSLSDNIVRVINQRRGGELLIGTEKGMDILDLTTGKFTSHHSSNDPYSLSDNAVWEIFVDQSQNIWIGTYFGGVNYVNLHSGRFDHYYPSGESNSLNGKAVSSFLEYEDGLWVGTEDGGLNYFHQSDKRFDHYPFKIGFEELSYHNIHALYKSSNRLFVGTFTGGLNVINLDNGKVKKFRSERGNSNSLTSNTIYCIEEDSFGNIWIGTTYGLNRMRHGGDQIDQIEPTLFRDRVIYDILEDHSGNLWVATYGEGLYVKDRISQTWRILRPGVRFISLFEDSQNRIWVGTDDFGLYQIENDSVKAYSSEFPIKTVYGILEDRQGNLWMSSNQGIICFNPNSTKYISFDNWGHIQGKQFNYGASYLDKNGYMYFGGTNGFNCFHPDSVLKYYQNTSHPLRFTKLELFNKEVTIKQPVGVLRNSVNYTEEVVLNHDQSVISITYAALDYISPNSVKYAYKMEGFENHWNEGSSLRRVTYTNLDPGQYTFKVRSYHTGNVENKQHAELKLIILPPFYQTKSAYLIYVVFILVFIVLMRRRTVKRIEFKNQEKLEKMKRKEEELFYKRKIEFFTEMAHEIRTPLSLIIAPLEKLMESGKTDSDTLLELSVMSKNSDRLLALINQLLDFRRVESEGYKLHTEKVELINLVRNIYDRFAGEASNRNIKISFSTEVSRQDVILDVEAFNKILSNLLSNAVKFARTRVFVEVEINENDGHFNVIVRDDGIGIPKSDLAHIFDRFFKVQSGKYQYNNLGGTGIGLSLAKSLTEMHDGCLSVASEEMKETSFTIQIPFVVSMGSDSIAYVSDPEGKQYPRLLIAEDDPELLTFLTNSFRESGFVVFPCEHGKVALNVLDDEEIDLVLTDMMMPEMDGVALCKSIKSNLNLSQIPVVILTAKSDAQAKIEALEVGADSHFTKPFKFKHILLTLQNLLKTRQQLKIKFSTQPLEDAASITFNSRDEEFVNQVIQLVHANISDNKYSTETLSHDVGISRSGLHKKLKGISGISPNEFIRLIRLKYAAKLLMTGNHNISEVGYLSGFSSPSYFTKCFHEQFQKTPKEFISQLPANLPDKGMDWEFK